MKGYVDAVAGGVVRGWAEDASGEAVAIAVMLGDERIGAGRADQFRGDLGRDVGYRIELTRTIGAADFLDGRAWVQAIGRDGRGERLPLSEIAGFVEAVLGVHLRAMSGVQFREMIGRVLLDRELADRTPVAVDPRVTGVARSSFNLAVGTLSPDAEVIVGRGGHMFLITGSNGLIGQYVRSPDTDALAENWVSLLERRRAALRRRNIAYVQLFIPEKASVLAELLPFPVRPPTPLYETLAARLTASPVADAFVDLYASFAALTGPEREQLYLTIDSHLSCRGACRLFGLVLGKLGLPAPEPAFTERVALPKSDLAHHFPWVGFVEDDLVPLRASLPIAAAEPECIVDERTARHQGTRLVFRNPRAPIRKRVVAFANSFFAPGETMQNLSWWMKHWFEEYHFLWSSEVDLAYVDHVRPDVVIAQTVERFLPLVPNA